MAAPLLRQHLLPLGGLVVLLPKRSAFAEESKKSIYDYDEPSPREIAHTTYKPQQDSEQQQPPPQQQQQQQQQQTTRRPTPTDKLAAQIMNARLTLHSYATRTEDAINNGMTRFMSAEHNFTSTLASLAPPKESNETLLPGGIYVLVAAMAGSIVSRNRNFLFRFVTPILTGVVTAHYVVPRTTENVGNLVWEYEKRFPVLADNHVRARDGVRHFIETGKAHSQMGVAMAEEKVQGVTHAVQDWVKKGR